MDLKLPFVNGNVEKNQHSHCSDLQGGRALQVGSENGLEMARYSALTLGRVLQSLFWFPKTALHVSRVTLRKYLEIACHSLLTLG